MTTGTKETKHKAFNKDECAFGREYDTGLSKFEYTLIEMSKANRIAYPDAPEESIAANALRDTKAIFEAVNKK